MINWCLSGQRGGWDEKSDIWADAAFFDAAHYYTTLGLISQYNLLMLASLLGRCYILENFTEVP